MGTTISRINIIDKSENLLCIAIIILKCHFQVTPVFTALNINWILVNIFFVLS